MVIKRLGSLDDLFNQNDQNEHNGQIHDDHAGDDDLDGQMEGLAISESKLDGDRDRKVPLLICQIIIIVIITIIP